jgi:hypothetical protein
VSLTYSIDEAGRLVTLRYADDPTYEEFVSVMHQVFADPRYQPGFSILGDRRAAEVATADYMRQANSFVRLHGADVAGSRWAAVVSSVAAYGMARMGQAMSHKMPVETGVFTDVDEALVWLRRDNGTEG